LFWNARLLIPAWLDTDLCCFRVGLDQLKEPELLAVLGDLLERRNHVNGGAGGQPQLTDRSASLSTDQHAEAHQLVLSTKPWIAFTTEAVTGLDGIIPSADALQAAGESNRFGGGLSPQPDWTRFMVAANGPAAGECTRSSEPCNGKRNRLAPIRILQSFFMKLRFKFARSKCRALKVPYVG
jgi:hypothetical protein